jgi:inorganic pyrophosphatase
VNLVDDDQPNGVTQADGDPLDICVLSERPINRAEVLLDARDVGGLLMIDNGVGHAEQVVLAALEDYSDMFGQESAR